MPCYNPVDCWKARNPNESGNYGIVFNPALAQLDEPRKLPCGGCIGCRLEKSRQWALRCLNESTLHEFNSFITLTYDEDNIPEDGSLHIEHWQQFIKKLRSRIHYAQKKQIDAFRAENPSYTIARPTPIRFFGCGEYGTEQDPENPNTIGRPHWHAIIFGWDFPDKILEKVSGRTTSELLSLAWGKGFADVGEMTLESAGYVARYNMKKINGDLANEHYNKINPETGEYRPIQPEKLICSRNPGIGSGWFKKYKKDLDKGYVTFKGQRMAYPKYYDKLYDKEDDNQAWLAMRQDKKHQIPDIPGPDHTLDRLRVKEKLREKRTKPLRRSLK